MSDPLITPDDLALAMNDPSINEDRALHLIAAAQTLCESVVFPLPAGAEVVVERVACDAYVSITSARQIAALSANGGSMPRTGNGVRLSRADKADLRRLAGGGGSFTIDLLPADYAAPLPPWDVNTADISIFSL